MNSLLRVCLTIGCSLHCAAAPADSTPRRMPGCAETAAFSLMRSHGSDVSLSEVARHFEQDPDFRPFAVSLYELRCVLGDLGFETQAVSSSPGKVTDLPCPCILYFRPGKWIRGSGTTKVGHFVTLLKINTDDQSALIADWAPFYASAETQVPLETLRRQWDGEAIVVAESTNGGMAAGALIAAILIGVGVFFQCRRSAHGKSPSVRLMGLLVLSASIAGCDSDAESESPTGTDVSLSFEKPVVDLGLIDSASRVVEFDFTVTGTHPVTIKSLDASCTCTAADTKIFDQPLQPGTRHTLAIKLSPTGAIGSPQTPTAQVVTDPPSPAPLLVAVSYRRSGAPVISHPEQVVRCQPGKRAKAQFRVTYHRAPDDPQVLLVPSQCTLDGFEFENCQTTTEIYDSQIPGHLEQVAIDTTTVHLRSKEKVLQYGTSRTRHALRFSDGETRSLLIDVVVRHPFAPALNRVYAGRLSPSQQWSLFVPVRYSGSPEAIRVSHSVRVDDVRFADQQLVIKGRAPNHAGRFSGEVKVSFEDGVPPVHIPVTGIVISEAQ